MDVILTTTGIEHLRDTLLLSTIWFDVTDGRTFYSHHDDGLFYSNFQILSQTLGQALSGNENKKNKNENPTDTSVSSIDGTVLSNRPLRVVKYYAIAMPTFRTHTSPIVKGELHNY